LLGDFTVDKPPVSEEDYRYGVKVVSIGDLRVARGKTRRPVSTCKHKSVVYDQTERRVYCKDCEQEIDPFDAFMNAVEYFDDANKRLQRRADEIKEVENFTLRRRASKAMDQAWRRKNMVPCCVNCGKGMLPEDYVTVGSQVCREWAEAAKKRE